MLREHLGWSADIFSALGALTSALVTGKVVLGLCKFFYVHFLSPALGLGANLKQAGSWGVVTGCTDGIGRAYAEQLAAKGLNVVLISRTLARLTDMAKEVEEKYKVKTQVIEADFSRLDIYDDIRSRLDNLDIGVLVNNVGKPYDHPEYFAEVEEPDFAEMMVRMNCLSVAKMTEIVLPSMVKKRSGFIINIGSYFGSEPTPFFSLYSATKACVDVFTRSLALEYNGRGVTFQSVRPHLVVTKLSKVRRTSFYIPTPPTYVKAALSTVGVQAVTSGYWPHSLENDTLRTPITVDGGLSLHPINPTNLAATTANVISMDLLMKFVPKSVSINRTLNLRRLALKKKAERKQRQ